MMNFFKQAFDRERNPTFKRGGRKISDIGSMLSRGIPEYVVRYRKAIDEYEKENYIESLKSIRRSIDISDIDDWQQYAFLGNLLEDMRNHIEAIQAYETAIDMNLNDVNVYAQYHQIGYNYLQLGDYSNALKFYTIALDLKKSHPNSSANPDREGIISGILLGVPLKRIYNNRANANTNLGNLNQGLEDCKNAIAIDSQYSNPYIQLAQIFYKAGQENEAIKFLKVAASLGNSNAVAMLRQMGVHL